MKRHSAAAAPHKQAKLPLLLAHARVGGMAWRCGEAGWMDGWMDGRGSLAKRQQPTHCSGSTVQVLVHACGHPLHVHTHPAGSPSQCVACMQPGLRRQGCLPPAFTTLCRLA